MKLKTIILIGFSIIHTTIALAQEKNNYTHQDTLRGSIGKGRLKWNVLKYEISVHPDFVNKTISGENKITLMDSGINLMQIDLQKPMILDSVVSAYQSFSFEREENIYWIKINSQTEKIPVKRNLIFYFHGKPQEAINPPWDGGWIWKKDKNGNPWISIACQGLGASVWYPCKDTQEDKPDEGAVLNIIIPDSLAAIGNGRLKNQTKLNNHLMKYTWTVTSPINNYNIVPYIGKYTHFSENYAGLKGNLNLDYWVLDYNLEKAKKQFKEVKKMMKAFEFWFGAYPFYEDGYKLVEAPHLGMEHQSAVAYGNKFVNGYLGRDLSNSGWGMKWDFIIVHESGHEWFGNNITARDIADMWIQEGFTNYSETLFTEYYYGKKAANQYVQGLRDRITNEKNIIGSYGVNKEGSSDMYDKGGNLIHTIRQIINDDNKFRKILIGLNQYFYHSVITSKQVEDYISLKSGTDLSPVFNQYLRTTKIPKLEYYFANNNLYFRWTNTIAGFKMPVKIKVGTEIKESWIYPENDWNFYPIKKNKGLNKLKVNSNFFIESNEVSIPEGN
jgi:aminopeptidase N